MTFFALQAYLYIYKDCLSPPPRHHLSSTSILPCLPTCLLTAISILEHTWPPSSIFLQPSTIISTIGYLLYGKLNDKLSETT